ncbi:uncharacterized protein LOC124273454 isoform X2 [Haliotis rubra]|uniref:uncharacterized protein LOC124273454 isoform X2 n=1 Tax=Haliotis rubra TaxID=36100 RepID=UPI001EE5D66A|nr:uncharacterized protein LOC124273454 isoform X2 [Haliotis rubra]
MTKSVSVWIYITCLCCLLQPVCTGIIYTSKVCYGSGRHCIQHGINCSDTQKIAIVDAYYTNNTECGQTGLANCHTVNPDSVTERGYHRFSINEVFSLYKNCSRKPQCRYRAPRRVDAYTFSVVKYRCIETSDPFSMGCDTEDLSTTITNTESIVDNVFSTKDITSPDCTTALKTRDVDSTRTKDINTHKAGQTINNTGAIAGGVVATVLVVLIVTLVSVWIIRQRRANTDAKPDMTYSLAGKIPQNNYHEIQELKTQNSDYDYATADGMGLPPTTNTYFTIEPAGKQTARDNSAASAAEGEYDHIGDKPSQQTSDYDTTTSVAQPGHIGEEDYGYNHFQKKVNTQTHQNDYDTAASASKAVAQIISTERNTDEDDYDHFHRGTNGSETVSSPYDTTSGVEDNSDYSVA